MPVFQYKAINQSGNATFGTLEAGTKESVLDILSSRGETALEIKPKTKSLWQTLNQPLELKKGLSKQDILTLTQEIARLLKAGIQVERSLMILLETHQGKGVNQLLGRVLKKVRDGSALSDALAAEPKIFPLFYVQVVRAGELSGTLDDAFLRLSQLLERQNKFKNAVVSALIYPSILMVLVAVTLVIVVGVVLPEFEAVFRGREAELPFVTRFVMGFGNVVTGYWLFALGLLGLSLWGVSVWLKKDVNRETFDRRILTVKGIGPLLAKGQVALILRNLGSMVANGVPLSEALPLIVGTVKNRTIKKDLKKTQIDFKEGARLSSLLSKLAYFPKTSIQLVRVGEETGNLGPMIEEAATLLEHDVETAMTRFLAVFSPTLTLLMGGLIAAIIGAVLLGILSINEMAF